MSILHEGMILSLRSLSTTVQSDFFLDGQTLVDSVGFAPSTEPPYVGTYWGVHSTQVPDVFRFECLGNSRNPNEVGQALYLDGQTTEGTVGLTARTDQGATGTAWKVIDDQSDQGNKIFLQCQGERGQWAYGFLAGHPLAPNVRLSLGPDSNFRETTWEIILPEGPLPGGVGNPPPHTDR
jgi:hypothetical protein